MKISVVTVAYNSAATVRQTIESFLRQDYGNKELLIVDGGSTDETVAIAKSFQTPSIRVLTEKDDGIYDAMNKGLRLFNGEAVGFLNSDDTFHSDKSLHLIAEGLMDADIVFGDLYMVTDHATKCTVRTWKAGKFSRSAFRVGWAPPHATFYVRRGVVHAVGAFDLRYRIASDYDYMLRALADHCFRIKYVPHVLVDYRWGGVSSGSFGNMLKGNLECLDSRRRHLKSAAIDVALFLRPMRRLLQLRLFKPRPRRR
jgi:glycosyltransferase